MLTSCLLCRPECDFTVRTHLTPGVQNQQRYSNKKDHPHNQGEKGDGVLGGSGIQKEHEEERRHDYKEPYAESSPSQFRDHALLRLAAARRPATLGYAILLAELPCCDEAGRQVSFEGDGIFGRTVRIAEALLVHRAARMERT